MHCSWVGVDPVTSYTNGWCNEQRGLCESASRASECGRPDSGLRPVRLVRPVRPVRPVRQVRPVRPVRQIASAVRPVRQIASDR
eukprot:4266316-Prymnesium_polylepis.1